MPYIDRNADGNIVCIYANPQRENHEWVDTAELWVPQPTHADMVAETLRQMRAMRLEFFKVLDGLQVSAVVTGDNATALSIETAKQVLRDLPTTLDFSGMTTAEEMQQAVLTAYWQIRQTVPANVQSAFNSLVP